ncbi:MAG: hypothetical protein JXN59_00290, partial [Anaerolineae bacterium]|nr:hypothetical protein [Anaerolineae bacterium]
MSTPSQSPGAEQSRFQRFMTAAPVRIAVLLIVVLWSIPTAGVLISSFRTPAEINTSGWWTALSARTNAEYKTLVERVDRSETFTERTEAQLEEARAALEAGVSAESLSEAIAEAE